MKLLIVTAIRELRDDLDRIFRMHGVNAYSMADIQGFRNDNEQQDETENWFGNDSIIPFDSVLAFSFTNEKSARAALQSFSAFNEKSNPDFPVRAFIVPVEASI